MPVTTTGANSPSLSSGSFVVTKTSWFAGGGGARRSAPAAAGGDLARLGGVGHAPTDDNDNAAAAPLPLPLTWEQHASALRRAALRPYVASRVVQTLDPVQDASTAFRGGRAMLRLGFERLGEATEPESR